MLLGCSHGLARNCISRILNKKKDNFELAVIEREQTCNFVSSLFMRKNVSIPLIQKLFSRFHCVVSRDRHEFVMSVSKFYFEKTFYENEPKLLWLLLWYLAILE